MISRMAQYHVHKYSSLLLGCQMLIFPMGHTTCLGTFFHAPRPLKVSFLEKVPKSVS